LVVVNAGGENLPIVNR